MDQGQIQSGDIPPGSSTTKKKLSGWFLDT